MIISKMYIWNLSFYFPQNKPPNIEHPQFLYFFFTQHIYKSTKKNQVCHHSSTL